MKVKVKGMMGVALNLGVDVDLAVDIISTCYKVIFIIVHFSSFYISFILEWTSRLLMLGRLLDFEIIIPLGFQNDEVHMESFLLIMVMSCSTEHNPRAFK